MEFENFCAIVKSWKSQGKQLKIKDLNTNEIDNVITYEVTETTFESGTIISFVVKPSQAHMICKNNKGSITEINKNLYEVKVSNEQYQIIIK